MKSMGDLRNAKLLFSVIESNVAVRFFRLLTNLALRIHFPVAWAVKPTLYRQFVGGETLQQCVETVDLLKSCNVMSVLDFSAEGGASQKCIERSYKEILKSIDFATIKRHIPYTVFKSTAMVYASILEKAAMADRFPDISDHLAPAEQGEIDEFRKRIISLCHKAHENNVRILVDAEHYITQDILLPTLRNE